MAYITAAQWLANESPTAGRTIAIAPRTKKEHESKGFKVSWILSFSTWF
jgi:hypothetical protein